LFTLQNVDGSPILLIARWNVDLNFVFFLSPGKLALVSPLSIHPSPFHPPYSGVPTAFPAAAAFNFGRASIEHVIALPQFHLRLSYRHRNPLDIERRLLQPRQIHRCFPPTAALPRDCSFA
jgi:hypothetical protein